MKYVFHSRGANLAAICYLVAVASCSLMFWIDFPGIWVFLLGIALTLPWSFLVFVFLWAIVHDSAPHYIAMLIELCGGILNVGLMLWAARRLGRRPPGHLA